MSVEGFMYISTQPATGSGEPFNAIEAATGAQLEPKFKTASPDQVELAIAAAALP
ncbi:MAG: hypothetical protein ABI673_09385 [Novosphingobium sp.]